MNWLDVIDVISIVGLIFAILITSLGFILFLRELKNPRNESKIVAETSLEKYSRVMFFGTLVTTALGVIVVISRGIHIAY